VPVRIVPAAAVGAERRGNPENGKVHCGSSQIATAKEAVLQI
jgi:hypothetical protein